LSADNPSTGNDDEERKNKFSKIDEKEVKSSGEEKILPQKKEPFQVKRCSGSHFLFPLQV
jgi:hypothetical protein